MSILLGLVLAVGTWITLTTMYAGGPDRGIIQNFGNVDAVLFLQISLTENWLIFITRCNGPFWASLPSWQLAGAILIVDIIATCFTIWGWFEDSDTSIVAVVRIWVFSFGVFCVMGGVYYMLAGSQGFDNLMHGKSIKGSQKQRSLEDFGKSSPDSLLLDEQHANTSQSSLSSGSPPSTRSRRKRQLQCGRAALAVCRCPREHFNLETEPSGVNWIRGRFQLNASLGPFSLFKFCGGGILPHAVIMSGSSL